MKNMQTILICQILEAKGKKRFILCDFHLKVQHIYIFRYHK